jgi:hypothetical protein
VRASLCSLSLQPQSIGTGDAAGVNNLVGSPVGTGGAIPSSRFSNYTGSTATPSVTNIGVSAATDELTGVWSTPAALNNFVSQLANGADQSVSGCGISGTTPSSASACTRSSFASGSLGTDASPLITYVNGDFNMGNSSGAGILIVTGTLEYKGAASFDGLILVVGQGIWYESGGGNGSYNGSVFLANTNSHSSPYAQLATLGSPQIGWSGGGSATIQHNSSWADALNNMHYTVVASREEMY